MMNTDFLKLLLIVAHQKLTQIQDREHCDRTEFYTKKKIFYYMYCSPLARLFYVVSTLYLTFTRLVADEVV